jgi:hypothetical protein
LCGFISPMREDRERVRAIVGADNFLEIHCGCSLEVCEQRDVKGLYKKAWAGIEADVLNVALFGTTAKDWRKATRAWQEISGITPQQSS